MSEQLIERVIGVIAATQHLPREKITPASTFQELGLDSMDAVNILFALENEFDISIPDEEARSIRNIGDMAEGVAKLIAAKAARLDGASQNAAQAPQ